MSTGDWLADRLGWTRVEAYLAKRSVPRHGFMFYVGGITLFLFLVQVASGVLLTLYYQPDAAQAHGSVERIVGEISYGDLVRAVHVWAGDLFVASLMLHMFIVMARRSFRAPQELTWLSGIALLALGVGEAFTGAVLPWSERACMDARVGSELALYVPLVGAWLRRLMRGGEDVTSNTLAHAFGFHVAALPAALTFVVAVHLFARSRNRAGSAGATDVPTIPLYPDFFVRLAVALTGVMVLVLTLAIFVERPIGPPADPRLSSALGLPPWYFLPMHAIVRAVPGELLGIDGPRFLVSAACVIGLAVVALPFIDRRGSRLTAWLAWIALLALILVSVRAIT